MFIPGIIMPAEPTIVILSGKGGTGKTLVSVNLAAAADQATYLDADVEEPNGQLFFKPTILGQQMVYTTKPVIDPTLCEGCRRCVDLCAFNALAMIGKELLVFEEVCHSCGLCTAICPKHALHEEKRPLGLVKQGKSDQVRFLSGEMRIGESSAVPIIKAMVHQHLDGLIIIDGPPGSGCLVQETIKIADFCLLVAEPSRFGAHNLEMVHELVTMMGKPFAVLLNKTQELANPSQEYALTNDLKIIGCLPYDQNLARLSSEGRIAVREDHAYRAYFATLLAELLQEVQDASNPHTQR
jgi:MinD superfamily P-loop ATPase